MAPEEIRMIRRVLPTLIVIAIVTIMAVLLYRTLSRYDFADIQSALIAIPASRIALAGLFAAASYLCLTGFDALAVRYVGHPLPYHQTAIASFIALSIGHNVGLAALSSGAIRYRFYSRWGLSNAQVAKVIVFCGVTVALGLTTLGGLALLLHGPIATTATGLHHSSVIAIGIMLLVVPLAYVLLPLFYRGSVGIRRWSMEVPSAPMAMGQVFIGTLNFAMVAASLYQILAADSDVDYVTVAAAYVIANTIAISSHVPGGLGVLEGTILLLLPGAPVFAALIAFRAVYFFIPLLIGAPSFLIAELAMRASSGRDAKSEPLPSSSKDG